jgi:hypothetical protein
VPLDDEPGSEYLDGRAAILDLTWLIWFFNVLCLGAILFCMMIALVQQLYELSISQSEAYSYQLKAKMALEVELTMQYMGFLSESYWGTLIIGKKKYTNDLQRRLDQEKWSGITHSIKTHLDFNVASRMQAAEKSADQRFDELREMLGKQSKILEQTQLFTAQEEYDEVYTQGGFERAGSIVMGSMITQKGVTTQPE